MSSISSSRTEYQIAESLCADLQTRNTELTSAQQVLEHEHRQQLETQEAERQKLAQEFLELRVNSEETARLVEELISTALNVPTANVATREDLEAAGIQPQDSVFAASESERTSNAMKESLASMGIQVDFR